MELPLLNLENAFGFYDSQRRIVLVTYQGVITPTLTIEVYDWMLEATTHAGSTDISRGTIFDFRKVTEFHNQNLRTTMSKSRNLNTKIDFSTYPIALLVGNMLQEQLVMVAMKLTSNEDQRKRVVKSEADALTFVNLYNQTHNRGEIFADISETAQNEFPVYVKNLT